MKNFTEMGLPTEITDAMAQLNMTSPTDIQAQAIPLALAGHDILASSQTGSGKTLAYLLPTLSTILKTGDSRVLILTPTRELTLQVCDTLNKLIRKLPVSGVAVIGGESFFKQTAKLRSRPQFIVGTPGRMLDHLTRKTIKLDEFRCLILDEMDSMLDMGMKKQLDQILNYMSAERQVLMFSATVPGHIQEISRKYLRDPKRITIGSATKPAPEVDQQFLKMAQGDKYRELGNQLGLKEGTAVVFVTTKRGADKLTERLKDDGHQVDTIHGGLHQAKRSKVIANFRAEKIRVLVATDVAARGLDINHIKLVFNYDLPMSAEDYLHRIGRTGRAGAKGHAVSFVSPDDISKWHAIQKLINKGESTPRESFKKKGKQGERPAFRKNADSEGNQKRYGKPRFSHSKNGEQSSEGRSDFRRSGGSSSEGNQKRYGKSRFSHSKSGEQSSEGNQKRYGKPRFSHSKSSEQGNEGRSDFRKSAGSSSEGNQKQYGKPRFSHSKSSEQTKKAGRPDFRKSAGSSSEGNQKRYGKPRFSNPKSGEKTNAEADFFPKKRTRSGNRDRAA